MNKASVVVACSTTGASAGSSSATALAAFLATLTGAAGCSVGAAVLELPVEFQSFLEDSDQLVSDSRVCTPKGPRGLASRLRACDVI